MDPDSLFSGFGAIGGYGPKAEKKQVRTPFAGRKRCVNASSFHTIFFMWACCALRDSYGGFAHVYYALFNHKPNLIFTRVNG